MPETTEKARKERSARKRKLTARRRRKGKATTRRARTPVKTV